MCEVGSSTQWDTSLPPISIANSKVRQVVRALSCFEMGQDCVPLLLFLFALPKHGPQHSCNQGRTPRRTASRHLKRCLKEIPLTIIEIDGPEALPNKKVKLTQRHCHSWMNRKTRLPTQLQHNKTMSQAFDQCARDKLRVGRTSFNGNILSTSAS